MKKVLLAAILIVSVLVSGEIFKIEKDYSIRTDYMPKPGTAIGVVRPNEEYEILDKYAGWVKVNFTMGTDHVGEEGWIPYRFIGDDNCITETLWVNKIPKSDNHLFKAKKGAKVAILKHNWSWVKIDLSHGYNPKILYGWVYIKAGKIINKE